MGLVIIFYCLRFQTPQILNQEPGVRGAKTVHALECAATGIGMFTNYAALKTRQNLGTEELSKVRSSRFLLIALHAVPEHLDGLVILDINLAPGGGMFRYLFL